jgi:hypothetical protein
MACHMRLARGVLALLIALGAAPAFAQSSSYFDFLMRGIWKRKAIRMARWRRSSGRLPPTRAPPKCGRRSPPFILRRNKRPDAESSALAALKLDDENAAAHRVLGLLYSANVDAMNARTPPAQLETALREAIQHLERAVVPDTEAGIDILYALGRMYMRANDPAKAGHGIHTGGEPEPRVRAGPPVAGAGLRSDARRQERDPGARRNRRGRAARGVRAGAVPRRKRASITTRLTTTHAR